MVERLLPKSEIPDSIPVIVMFIKSIISYKLYWNDENKEQPILAKKGTR